MNIVYDGTEKSIVEIICNLPGKDKAIKRNGRSITIPTPTGAKQVFIGDTVVIDVNGVAVTNKGESEC